MMETGDDRPAAAGFSQSCTVRTASDGKRSSRIRKIASGCVFWIGMALICVAAIPAGILFGIICLLVRVIDFLTNKIEKE